MDEFVISVSGTSKNKTFGINLFDIGYLILLFFMFLLLPKRGIQKSSKRNTIENVVNGFVKLGFVFFCVILSASSFRNSSSHRSSSFPLSYCS